MAYDLLISGPSGTEITTHSFFWIARLKARSTLAATDATYASITSGRHDIIWRCAEEQLPHTKSNKE